jgi:hypothetical protein
VLNFCAPSALAIASAKAAKPSRPFRKTDALVSRNGLVPFALRVKRATVSIMMHEFLSAHRDRLITRCQAKVAERAAPKATQHEMEHGIPLFIDQLIKTLRIEQGADRMQSRKVSGVSGGGDAAMSEMGEAAAQHGRELLERGSTGGAGGA